MPYVLTRNKPGYLPEAEPQVIELDTSLPAAPQLLEAAFDEVYDLQPEPQQYSFRTDPWVELLDEIESDRERAADFNPRNGFRYDLPDGEVLEITYTSEVPA